MGSLCAYITLLGFYSGVKENVVTHMKAILPTITLLSVIVPITIFRIETKEFLFSFRYIFSIGILLFIPLVFILGCLSNIPSQNTKDKNYILVFICLLISFCIGFIYGDLIIPLTRYRIPESEEFVSFPCNYIFLCSVSLFIGMTLYLLSNLNSGLSKSINRILNSL